MGADYMEIVRYFLLMHVGVGVPLVVARDCAPSVKEQQPGCWLLENCALPPSSCRWV